MHPDPAVALLEAALASLTSRGIVYSIASGTERLPVALGRDVDLLVRARHIGGAVDVFRQTAAESGWHVIRVHRRVNGHRWVFLGDRNSPRILEVDLVPFYAWFVFPVAHPSTGSCLGVDLQVDPWAHFAKRRLVPALSGRTAREEAGRQRPGPETSAEARVRRELEELLGERFPGDGVEALLHGTGEPFRLAGRAARAALVRRALTDPRRTLRLALPYFLRNKASSVLDRRLAPIVAIVGPDGVGKSTVIEEVTRMLPDLLPITGVSVLHWRPRLLPDLASILGRRGDDYRGGPGPPRRDAGRFASIRALYYGADVWLGYWLRLRLASARLTLTIFDRCYLDMAVDPLRFGLANGATARRLWTLLPKPDLILVLHDSAERVASRKGELTVEEVEQQYRNWAMLTANDERLVRVDVAKDAVATATCVSQLIVGAFLTLAGNDEESREVAG